MDFGQEYYDMFDRRSREKVPFYMTYPMRNSFLEEAEYDRDCRRLQEMYPCDARRIQSLVERECDKMEHEGSMMFDEYPDRLLFRMLCGTIYRALQDGGEAQTVQAGRGQPVMQGCGQTDRGRSVVPDREHPVMQMIEVMLAQEMYRRRCRYRRCSRRY